MQKQLEAIRNKAVLLKESKKFHWNILPGRFHSETF